MRIQSSILELAYDINYVHHVQCVYHACMGFPMTVGEPVHKSIDEISYVYILPAWGTVIAKGTQNQLSTESEENLSCCLCLILCIDCNRCSQFYRDKCYIYN